MKLLILFIVSIAFLFIAAGIAQYIYERENEDPLDDVWADLIDEIEHRGKGRER